jgi:hypothetical protein
MWYWPTETEYRTSFNYDGYGFWAGEKRSPWWPFWRVIRNSPMIKTGSSHGWCESEDHAKSVCEYHASRGGMPGTFLGVYQSE